jgi:hypothetical protein
MEAPEKQKPDENVVCDACGRYGAYDFCGTHLCLDCYGSRGACCPEFGAEDLTDDDTGEIQPKDSNV